MTQNSARLGLPLIMPAQAQKHITVNEAFTRLDKVVHCYLSSRSVSTQPTAPEEGEVYLLPATRSGTDWDEFAVGAIAVFEGGQWSVIPHYSGFIAYIQDSEELAVFEEADWVYLSTQDPEFSSVGVNTLADTVNRLSVKSDNVLFSHDDNTPGTGNMRLAINKAVATGTASTIFQSGWSGRAELGLIGGDDFSLQVSPDGTQFTTALSVNKSTGECSFPQSVMTNFGATILNVGAGTYTPAVTVKALKVTVIGGGGGGAGARSQTTSETVGAGGGGAGGIVTKFISADQLAASYTYSVGVGGAGGTADSSAALGARDGSDGTESRFEATGLSLIAGPGEGAPEDAGNSQFIGGFGGLATGGDLNFNGQRGGGGLTKADGYYQIGMGVGANTLFGIGGIFANGSGTPGLGYGSGGSGCGMVPGFILNRVGGDGAPGVIIIEEYS